MLTEENCEGKIKDLLDNSEEIMVKACMQGTMGKIYSAGTEKKSVCANIGCFSFLFGEPNEEIIRSDFTDFVIMVPENKQWCSLIESVVPNAHRVTRYATKKDTVFNPEKLHSYVSDLTDEYEIKKIDSDLYDKCLENEWSKNLVSAFETKEQFLGKGRGFAVVKNGDIVSGASSYCAGNDCIEIEVDTIECERKKHLATAVCSVLILDCIKKNIYPSWDAQNMNSLMLAKKL